MTLTYDDVRFTPEGQLRRNIPKDWPDRVPVSMLMPGIRVIGIGTVEWVEMIDGLLVIDWYDHRTTTTRPEKLVWVR